MAIQSKIVKEDKPEQGFPKLMELVISNKQVKVVLLFKHFRCGTVILSNCGDYKVSDHSDEWIMDCFKDYNGAIELSNKEL